MRTMARRFAVAVTLPHGLRTLAWNSHFFSRIPMEQPTSQFHRAMSAAPLPGEVIAGKYRVDNVLGAGGMSVVVGATHLNLDQRCAIKILLPEMASNDDFVERFLREGRALIRIRSEHVVRVLDVDTLSSGTPFLVMEYLEGKDLEAHLKSGGPLGIADAISMLLQAGEAIAEAHALGIVHRDLKPANLFLTQRPDGAPLVKVIDFGISTEPRARESRITTTHAVIGSPHYMSPEQLRSTRDVDARTDIWALGAILHELLAGSLPFKGETIPEVCANILTEPPIPLRTVRADVPRALEAVVLRCLAKDLSWRYDNLGKLAVALTPFVGEATGASVSRIVATIRAAGMTTEDVTTRSERRAHMKTARLRGRLARPGFGLVGSVIGGVFLVGLGAGLYIRERARAPALSSETPGPHTSLSEVVTPIPSEPVPEPSSTTEAAPSARDPKAAPAPRPPTPQRRERPGGHGEELFEDRK